MLQLHKCTICEKEFSQAQNLKTHEKTVHGESRVKCDQCEYTTGQKIYLHNPQVRFLIHWRRMMGTHFTVLRRTRIFFT